MTDSVDRLYEDVLAAKQADPAISRTARLLQSGRPKIAKKLAEEAVEVIIDAMNGNREAVVRESADLLYNLVVLWGASSIQPKDVWKEMNRREQLFGIAEKLLKRPVVPKARRKAGRLIKEPLAPKARRKVAALRSRQLQKRRSRQLHKRR